MVRGLVFSSKSYCTSLPSKPFVLPLRFARKARPPLRLCRAVSSWRKRLPSICPPAVLQRTLDQAKAATLPADLQIGTKLDNIILQQFFFVKILFEILKDGREFYLKVRDRRFRPFSALNRPTAAGKFETCCRRRADWKPGSLRRPV